MADPIAGRRLVSGYGRKPAAPVTRSTSLDDPDRTPWASVRLDARDRYDLSHDSETNWSRQTPQIPLRRAIFHIANQKITTDSARRNSQERVESHCQHGKKSVALNVLISNKDYHTRERAMFRTGAAQPCISFSAAIRRYSRGGTRRALGRASLVIQRSRYRQNIVKTKSIH
jgi:hypothetical protein